MEQTFYEIRVEGVLGKNWEDCYSGLQVEYENDSTGKPANTRLVLPGDTATLYGVLAQVGSLNLKMVSVRRYQAEVGGMEHE